MIGMALPEHERRSADTTATTNEPITSGSVQPLLGPSMTPNSSVIKPTIDNTVPRMSSRAACSSFDSGTNTTAATIVRITTGTLMRKIDPHQKCSSR